MTHALSTGGRKQIKRLEIWFWKMIGIVWDFRPRLHLPRFSDYPIASTEIADSYDYPKDFKILFEWDEKGKHWIVFSSKIESYDPQNPLL